MHSNENDVLTYLRADANVLGGLLQQPFNKSIPTIAPVSLPSVGGISTARSEAFHFENIVSISSGYTRAIGGARHEKTHSLLVTAVVEGLNILDVVTADRIVAQLSIIIPGERGPLGISFAGSSFDGLKIGGCKAEAELKAGEWTTPTRCSLVERLTTAGPFKPSGHILTIPNFGRFFFGELYLLPIRYN